MLRGTTPEDDISLLLAQTHTGRPPDTESVAACLELRSGR
jgi:hypothetical protein